MQSTFGIDPAEVIRISAKTGNGVERVLEAIIERIPPPIGRTDAPLKAFLFDSSFVNTCWYHYKAHSPCRYDRYRGVVSLVNIQGGILRKGKSISHRIIYMVFENYAVRRR
jgi:translation elongation factor EF-4